MAEYTAVVEAAVPVERAFAVFTDATRYPQWQALAQRAFEQTGPLSDPGSTVRIDHGPGMKRVMTVLACEPPRTIRYRQQGMGFDDTSEVTFESVTGGTRISMTTGLTVAGGAVGRVLERLGRGPSRREFQAELERFAAVLGRGTVVPPAPGTLVSADSGGGIRVLKVLGTDTAAGVVHVALLPGVDSSRTIDLDAALRRTPTIPDPLALRPLDVKLPGWTAKLIPGCPALRLDGGVGVPHLALDLDAFGDALPSPTGRTVDVRDDERAEIDSWSAAGGPVLGRTAEVVLTSLVTRRADRPYSVAKILSVDPAGIHLRWYADRWDRLPATIDPWALGLGTVHDTVRGIGHLPLTRAAFEAWRPSFERLAMVGPRELDGLRVWRDDGGGFATWPDESGRVVG